MVASDGVVVKPVPSVEVLALVGGTLSVVLSFVVVGGAMVGPGRRTHFYVPVFSGTARSSSPDTKWNEQKKELLDTPRWIVCRSWTTAAEYVHHEAHACSPPFTRTCVHHIIIRSDHSYQVRWEDLNGMIFVCMIFVFCWHQSRPTTGKDSNCETSPDPPRDGLNHCCKVAFSMCLDLMCGEDLKTVLRPFPLPDFTSSSRSAVTVSPFSVSLATTCRGKVEAECGANH